MKKLYGLGDIHFSDSFPWFYYAGENFLKMVEEMDFGPKEDSEILLTGDITDSYINAGDVIEQVMMLGVILSKKFRHVYVVCGNHDKKKHHDIYQNSCKFLGCFPNVTIIEDPQVIITENGFKCLCLPYIYGELDSMDTVFHNFIKTQDVSNLDIISGHWTIKEVDAFGGSDLIDISDFPQTKEWFIGHVHTRNNPKYLGSVWPVKTNEVWTPNPRGFKVLNEDRTTSHIDIPEILTFTSVEYQQELPKRDDIIQVFTISNCASKEAASGYYPGAYIKAIITPDNIIDEGTATVRGTQQTEDFVELFKQMLDEKNLKLSRPLLKLMLQTLSA